MTDTAEEASCNKKSSEDAPDGVAANRNTNIKHDVSGDEHTACRDIEAPVTLLGRGIPEKSTMC